MARESRLDQAGFVLDAEDGGLELGRCVVDRSRGNFEVTNLRPIKPAQRVVVDQLGRLKCTNREPLRTCVTMLVSLMHISRGHMQLTPTLARQSKSHYAGKGCPMFIKASRHSSLIFCR